MILLVNMRNGFVLICYGLVLVCISVMMHFIHLPGMIKRAHGTTRHPTDRSSSTFYVHLAVLPTRAMKRDKSVTEKSITQHHETKRAIQVILNNRSVKHFCPNRDEKSL